MFLTVTEYISSSTKEKTIAKLYFVLEVFTYLYSVFIVALFFCFVFGCFEAVQPLCHTLVLVLTFDLCIVYLLFVLPFSGAKFLDDIQIQGLWRVRHKNISPWYEEAKKLKDKFLLFQITHVLRVGPMISVWSVLWCVFYSFLISLLPLRLSFGLGV